MIAPPRFTFPILNPSTFSLFVLLATSKTQGAFISEHVEIRDIDEGLSGLVFASQSILKGEIISTVPLNLTISAAQSEYLDDEDDYDKEMCHLLHNVHSSIIKNDTIQTPYERYFTTKSNILVTLGSNPQIDHELNLNVMEWAKTQGAFISEHVEIRDIDEGLSGLFASQSILKGEIISTVPLNLTISAQSEYFDDTDEYSKEVCHLLHNVHSSIIKNDTIQTPYERYLTSRTHHHIPSNWSPQAKKMLKQLDGPATAPLFGFEFHDVKERIQTCGGFDENMATDSKFADAASLTYTRSEGAKGILALVPFMDLINHANGKRLNIDANHVLGEKFEFIATRAIEKGEQLNCSYNRCSYCTCFEQGNFVTPDLFFEYGFVETLPQRWAFANVDLIFDIDGKEGHGDDELEVNFVKPPTKADVYFMNKELKRLSFVRRRYLKNSERKMAKISELELDSITKYHKALVDAFTHALKSVEAVKQKRNIGTMAG